MQNYKIPKIVSFKYTKIFKELKLEGINLNSVVNDRDWNVYETPDVLKLSLFLPQINKSTLEILVQKNILKVLGEDKDNKAKKISKMYIWSQDFDDIVITYDDVLLKILATPVIKEKELKRIKLH